MYLGVAAPRVRAVVLSSVSARYFSSSSRHTPSKYLLSSLISRSCWARILTTNQRSVLTMWTNQRPVLPGHLLPVLRPQRLRSVARLVGRGGVHVGVRYLVLRLVNILFNCQPYFAVILNEYGKNNQAISLTKNNVLPTSDMVRLAGVKNEELRPELVSTREEDSLLLGLSAPLSILRRTLRSRDSRTWSFIN